MNLLTLHAQRTAGFGAGIWQPSFISQANGLSQSGVAGWPSGILILNIVADAIITLCFISIPLSILIFLYKRKDQHLHRVYLSFALFLVFCAIFHVIEIVSIWQPTIVVEGIVKSVTAVIALVSAVSLWFVGPEVRKLPSARMLEETNRRLKEINSRYQLVLDGANVGIYEWYDISSESAIYWSARLFELLGLDPKEFQPSVSKLLALVHPDDFEKARQFLERHLFENENYLMQIRLKTGWGEYRWFQLRGSVLRDAAGMPLRMAGSVEDIHDAKTAEIVLIETQKSLEEKVNERTQELEETVRNLELEINERRKIEQELAKSKDIAEKASRAKTQFLANMSHEIRTPLGLVTGFAELLLNSPSIGTEVREYGEVIQRNGALLSKIIDDILDLSKIEAGKLRLDVRQCDINLLIKDLYDLFALKCDNKGLAFNILKYKDVPNKICTDEIRLKQILVNIIGNAIKFTDKGKIEVRIGCQTRNGKRYISFNVEDTGKGIEESKKAQIFEEFTQEDDSIQRSFGGTGLGLNLSRKFANALGGNVELVRSTLQQGSEFLILIEDQDQKVVTTTSPSPVASQPIKLHPPNLANFRVLVVDDVIDNLCLINILLKKTQARTILCSEPQKAASLACEHKVDLVLLDIQMPELDGFQVLKDLRNRKFTNHVWALTALSMKDEVEKVFRSGFDDYLGKPISANTFYQKLAQFARNAQAASLKLS